MIAVFAPAVCGSTALSPSGEVQCGPGHSEGSQGDTGTGMAAAAQAALELSFERQTSCRLGGVLVIYAFLKQEFLHPVHYFR